MDSDSFPNIFNALPFEILEIIFSYLNPSDLKSLLDLSGRLRNVIIASPISMRKLPLNLTENWSQKVPFIRSHGSAVKLTTFEFCDFDSPEQFRDMLKMMPEIESLKLADIHIDAEKMNRKFRKFFMDFERLEKLDIDNSKAVGKLVRLYLKDLQVAEMRLDFSHFNVTEEFVRLLWNQPCLNKLELSGFDNIIYKSLFPYDISYMIMYQLRKLVLNHRVTPNDNFLKFFNVLESLEQLEVLKEVEYPEFLNAIFEHRNLSALTLATNFVTLKNVDFKKIPVSKLKELTLVTRSQYGIETTINFMLEKFLCLKTLKVVNQKTDSSDQMLAFVKLKGIENFYVENSKLKFFQNIQFSGLKRLEISGIHAYLKFEDWEKFFKANEQLEVLIMSDFEVYYVTENIKAEIDKIIYNLKHVLKNLRYFEIHQELRYQKPVKLIIKQDKEKIMKVSDSFIKIFRPEFHMLRKMYKFHVQYLDDDCLEINNKYLVAK